VVVARQMRSVTEESPQTKLVLAFYIDASLGRLAAGSGTEYQTKNTEQHHARKDTYFGHGSESLDAAIDVHEDSVVQFLQQSGVVMDDLIGNYELDLVKLPASSNSATNSSWDGLVRSGKLMLRPLVIGLRLQDIDDAYYQVWQANKGRAPSPELAKLFRESDIPDGMEESWPADAFRALDARILNIKTDFVLRGKDRKVLDLAAYLIVQGRFEAALAQWDRVVISEMPAATAK
jgi:hypothetical protein